MPQERGFLLGTPLQPKVAVEPEPDLSDDDLRVLLHDDAPPAGGDQKPVDGQAEEEESEEEDAASGTEELAQLKQDLARTQGALAALMRGGQPGAPGTPQDPIEAFTKKFFADRYADVPEETRAFFQEYGKGLVNLVAGAVGQRLQGIEKSLQDSSGKQILTEFEDQLDTVMTRAGLADAEKEIFKESVMMDGLRRYGNNFTTDQAIKLFRAKHQKYLGSRQARQAKDETELDNDNSEAPPPTRRGGNLAAREDVMGKLMRSNAPENTFGGRNWRQYVAGRIKEKAKQIASGGA